MGHTTIRRLLAPLIFFSSVLLSAQALAFDVGGFSYDVINATDVEVTGRAAGNTDTDIVIPATVSDGSTTYSVAAIEGGAFFANALTSVSMPGSVTNIEDGAFNSNALTSVIIPDSVTTIGDYSFGNNALASVTIGNSVTSIGYAAFNNNALVSVTIPDSVTSIAGAAFILNALTGVIIPDSVTSIGVEGPISGPPLFGRGFTFANNSLTSAAFKGNSSNFNFNMFSNNSALTDITYCNGTAGWPQNFNNGSTIIVTEPVNCLPDAPTIDSIGSVNGEAIITFTPGADNGSPITSYTATCTDGSADYTGTSPTSPITVSGLTNGVSYVCVVSATSDEGTSPNSELSAPFTPVAPPSAPLITGIEPGNAQVSISVSVADDGGLPITGYTAACFGNSIFFGTSATSPITVSGLTNGESYVCAVIAINDVGAGPAAGTEPVTPAAPPPGC